ncbi:metallophosphoesterase [Psychrosphaera sp.]|nr:metallophosphoesterase [Psychrosphaera sp.]
MKLLVKALWLSLFSVLINACDYELSPWETDAYCPGMTITENLRWLKEVESQATAGNDFQFAIIGDPQQFPKDLENTIERLNKNDKIKFIVLLGDIAETGIAQEFEWACKALEKTNKPILSVVGNHDGLSFGQEIWRNTFGPFDYSFTFLDTKFIAFNNNQYEFENVPDISWIQSEADIAKEEQRFHTIAMSHIKPWDNQPTLSATLKDAGIDYTFHTHDHKFIHWQDSDVMLPHHVTANNLGQQFSIVNVSSASISVEDCTPNCEVSLPTTRN